MDEPFRPSGLLCMLELYTCFSDLGCLVCTAFLEQNLKFYFLLLPLLFSVWHILLPPLHRASPRRPSLNAATSELPSFPCLSQVPSLLRFPLVASAMAQG